MEAANQIMQQANNALANLQDTNAGLVKSILNDLNNIGQTLSDQNLVAELKEKRLELKAASLVAVDSYNKEVLNQKLKQQQAKLN